MRRALVLLMVLAVAAPVLADEPVRPHLLITNDDGVDAPGLGALVHALKDGYRLTVVAPAVEQSGVGHGITFRIPVLVEERPSSDGVRRFAVHAQPATCARLGIANLLAADPPVAVLSGINRGDNVGQSAWISGTLGGAREAALMGLPGIAISATLVRGQEPDWPAAGRLARLVVDDLLAVHLPLPGHLVKVEIPFPAAGARGFRITRMGSAPPEDQTYHEKPGPRGERLFQATWAPPAGDAPGTDIDAVVHGFVSITPLTVDQTDFLTLPALAAIPWPLPAPPATPSR